MIDMTEVHVAILCVGLRKTSLFVRHMEIYCQAVRLTHGVAFKVVCDWCMSKGVVLCELREFGFIL